MSSLPCPNPLCTNVFSAADVRKTGTVTCPKCGKEFRFRRPSGAAPNLKTPAAAPPSAQPKVPVAKPVVSAPPPASPASPPPSYGHPPPPVYYQPPPSPSGKPTSIVKVRGVTGAKPRHWLLKLSVTAVVVGIFLTAVFFAIRTWEPLLQFQRPTAMSGAGYVYYARNLRGGEERALTLTLDKDAWAFDKDLRTRLKATSAFKRADATADAWLAIAVQDFGFRKAREGELLNSAIDRLRGLFEDSLQVNAKLEPAKIAGVDAWRFTFKGRLNVIWWGECYLVPHHGFGYSIFLAAPTLDIVQTQFAELEDSRSLALTTDRAGWTEQPPELDMFLSLDNAFSVKTPDKVWRQNDPKTEDEAGVIYLSGHFQSMQPQSGEWTIAKNATLFGIALDKTADMKAAFAAAVAAFEKMKQAESKDYKFAPSMDGATLDGELADVGDRPGCIGEMRLLRGKDTVRYLLLAAFNEGPKTYGLRFECSWENREIWRKEFRDALATIRTPK